MVTNIAVNSKYNAVWHKKNIYSRDSFLCNVDPSSGPVADMFIPFLLLQTLVLELVWQSSCWLGEGQKESKHPPCVPSCLHMSDCTPAALHNRPTFLAHVRILYFCTENTYTVNCGCFKCFYSSHNFKKHKGQTRHKWSQIKIKACFRYKLFRWSQDLYLVISCLLFFTKSTLNWLPGRMEWIPCPDLYWGCL